jgi:hypothetical protein
LTDSTWTARTRGNGVLAANGRERQQKKYSFDDDADDPEWLGPVAPVVTVERKAWAPGHDIADQRSDGDAERQEPALAAGSAQQQDGADNRCQLQQVVADADIRRLLRTGESSLVLDVDEGNSQAEG